MRIWVTLGRPTHIRCVSTRRVGGCLSQAEDMIISQRELNGDYWRDWLALPCSCTARKAGFSHGHTRKKWPAGGRTQPSFISTRAMRFISTIRMRLQRRFGNSSRALAWVRRKWVHVGTRIKAELLPIGGIHVPRFSCRYGFRFGAARPPHEWGRGHPLGLPLDLFQFSKESGTLRKLLKSSVPSRPGELSPMIPVSLCTYQSANL